MVVENGSLTGIITLVHVSGNGRQESAKVG
jgi:hypothetical protein